ncbi:MAG: septum formation initiator family protein [bacterium]|nr:septum formation initiator family protein [bacterium]
MLFLFLAFSFGREYMRNRQIQMSIAQLETQAQYLEIRNVEIAQLNAELESERFLEKEARLRLGLAKPGERVVIISDGSNEDMMARGDKEELDLSTISTLQRWWMYFFDTEQFDRVKLIERARL